MIPATPAATQAASIPPSSPHAKGASQPTRSSLSGSPSLRSVLKLTSSPRSEPPLSPKIASARGNSPRVFFVCSPEESHLMTISDKDRVEQLVKVFSVFLNTQEVLKKVAEHLLEEIDTDQDEIFRAYKAAVRQDEAGIGNSFIAVIRAKEEFLKKFEPWYRTLQKEVIDGATRRSLSLDKEQVNLIKVKIDTELAKMLNKELKDLSKKEQKDEDKEDELDPLFLSHEYCEFEKSFEAFKKSVRPLRQKYGVDLIPRLQAFRFLTRDKNFETFSGWIRHHFLQAVCGPKHTNSNENTPVQNEQFSEEIVEQKDRQFFTNLFYGWGKKRTLINSYNRALIQFYVRHTKLLFITPEERAVRIRIFLLWELCKLSHFVNRLDRYLAETQQTEQNLRDKVSVFLNIRGNKASKIVKEASEFIQGCHAVDDHLKQLSQLSSYPVYSSLQVDVQIKLIKYLSEQDFVRKNPSQDISRPVA